MRISRTSQKHIVQQDLAQIEQRRNDMLSEHEKMQHMPQKVGELGRGDWRSLGNMSMLAERNEQVGIEIDQRQT